MQLWMLASEKSAGWVSCLETQARAHVAVRSEGHLLVELLLAWGRATFVLLSCTTDWIGPRHIMEGQSDLLKAHQVKSQPHPNNTFTETLEIIFD